MKNFTQSQQDSTSILYVLENKLTLTCDMCNHPVLHPQICPSCNQIFCYQCLLKYHQTSKNCPLCHQKLSLNQFMQFDSGHVLQFFRQQLKQLKLSKQSLRQPRFGSFDNGRNQKDKEQQQKCPEHEIPLKYFCQTCSKPICSDCGMMSGHHKNHKFIRLNDIYTKIKQKLNNELKRMSNKIAQSQQYGSNIKTKLEKLQAEHMHIKRYTQEYYILLVEKFQEEITSKTKFLKEMQQKNNAEIDFYELYRDGICEEIQLKTRFELIKDSDQILTSFTIQTCEPPEPLKIQESLQTIKQLLPDYNNFQYTLQNVSLCAGGIVYSDPFLLNGVEWRLKIYPKGNGVAKGKYLSVFVEMTKAQKSQKKYEYKIQLICKELTSQNIRRQYCSAFDIGQCWGYNQFILLEDLVNNGFLDEDKLHFIMGIRNPDYRSLSQDQSNYILKLENEIKIKELERQNEMQQTNIIDQLENNSYSFKSNGHSNQTKFLKFLQNSSFNEQRINERKQKQRQKQLQRSQKDQEFQDFHEIHQLTFKKQQATTNNLQISQALQLKPQTNEFFIQKYSSKQDHFSQFDQNQYPLRNKETLKRTKHQFHKEQKQENCNQSKYAPLGFTHHKQTSIKDKKIERLHPTQTQQRLQIKPQKKQEKNPLKTQEQTQEKYDMYFSSSKKHYYQPKKQKESRKHESMKPSQEDNLIKKQLKPAQMFKPYKNEFKQIKKSLQSKTKHKIQEQKTKKYEQQRAKKYEQQRAKKCEQQRAKKYEQQRSKKYEQQKGKKSQEQKVKYESKDYKKVEQQKREGIRTKKYIKSSPPKTKNEMDESENRKKQISTILQQSKKLQGISEQKVNSFLSNMSEVKDSTSSQSMLRSPVKTTQSRQQKEESKPSLKKLKQFEFERN